MKNFQNDLSLLNKNTLHISKHCRIFCWYGLRTSSKCINLENTFFENNANKIPFTLNLKALLGFLEYIYKFSHSFQSNWSISFSSKFWFLPKIYGLFENFKFVLDHPVSNIVGFKLSKNERKNLAWKDIL